MLRALKRAYGAGCRAGKAQRLLITQPDGTKTLAPVVNPYTLRRKFLLALIYEEAFYRESMRSLTTWLKSRKGSL